MIGTETARVLGGIASLILCLAASAVQAAHELDGRDIAVGQSLYVDNCASCHGVDLEGQPDWQVAGDDGILPAPPHNERGHTWHHANGLLFEYTKLGGEAALAQRGVSGFKSGMPGFADVLSDDAIWDILAYIRSTWPQRIQDNHNLRNPPHE